MQKIIALLGVIACFSLSGQGSLNMTKMSEFDIHPGKEYNDIWGYTDASGNEYAIVGSENAINIVNITDCSNPILDSAYVDGSSVIWRDFKTYDHYVYGICDGSACNNEGLEIINMNTGEFKQITSDFPKAHNIFIEEQHGRLYVVGQPGASDLIIYDLTADPWNPTLLVDHDFGSGNANYIHDIYVKDHIAHASHGYSGHAIYDVSNPASIVMLSDYTASSAYNHSSWTTEDGNYSYVAFEVPTGVPIDIYRLDGSHNITKMGDFSEPQIPGAPTLNRPHNPFVKGDSLYISYYHDGVQVWDITKRECPELVGYYDTEPGNSNYSGFTGAWGMYPFFDSGCIVASDINNGFFSFNMPTPPPADPIPEILVDNTTLVIDDSNKGIVFTQCDGTMKVAKVDNAGDIVLSNISAITNPVEVKNSDLILTSPGSSLVLKSPNGTYYEIGVDASNNIYTTSVFLSPGKVVSMQDIMFDSFARGIVLNSDDSRIVNIVINGLGQLEAVE